jgi:hypothetical protein
MRSQIGHPGTADAQTPRSPSRPVVLRRQAFCAALGLRAGGWEIDADRLELSQEAFPSVTFIF